MNESRRKKWDVTTATTSTTTIPTDYISYLNNNESALRQDLKLFFSSAFLLFRLIRQEYVFFVSL
jgi:hypothetical protein